ncbi:xanthine dehydrogenase family protein molybdopterin-binding subunit [Schnuerera sp. xch1]|uniref:xanthine dehydrogenase family protein molybdopterin-binding subunit n=1 Tax=Schnuerera sp. xch1 TaxID=2874283 RepID=UPI001CBEBE5A|nr:xanthine dehydrogenase family protein molybdopterin-binding subunit [Schnuerera sp. xch1]MBZ2175181.1 xanthine dehydrogenase family protein molybdopterin-binding subunit [Schnuerera sp. xch1]
MMDKKEFRHIGKPLDRVDALEKVTGKPIYVHDMELPGMLYAKVLHSPYARAKIKSIDTSAAEVLSGVKAILTGKDTSHKIGLYLVDKRIIARDITRYQGEVVAAVAAVDEATAERAISLIKVEYEELPAVLTIDDALEGEILVHEDINELDGGGVFFPQKDSNIASWNKTIVGDVEKAFEEADLVVESKMYLPAAAHTPLETHVAIAEADPYSDKIKIWTSAQSPFAVRQLMAKSFGISEAAIQVIVPSIGGGFGGKAGVHLEPLITLLSKACNGRPVKLKATRREEFNQLPTRAAMRSRIKTGVMKDGKITALKVYYDWDSGAYADYGANVGRTAIYSGAGPYEIPNVEIHSRTLYTNKVFSTAYRGFGHLETHWIIERQMDIIAQKLGMDPYDFRMKNVLKPGKRTISGEIITESTGSPSDCLKAVVEEIDWAGYQSDEERNRQLKTGKVRGKGFALLHKAPSMPTNTATSVIMQMDGDGKVKVLIGAIDMGQGANTVVAQIVAEVLDIPIEDVEVVWGADTDKHPYDWQTVASKFTLMGGNAVIRAANDMLGQMKEVAAQVFRCNVDKLRHKDSHIYHVHHMDKSLPYSKLARGYVYEDGSAIGGIVIGRGSYIADGLTNLDPETGQGLPALSWTYGAHGVDLEVDVETGDIHIFKIASAFDVGRVINRKLIDGQIKGGVVQGLGSAIFEGYIFNEDGQVMNPSFTDYKIPTAMDIPDEMVSIFIENPEFDGPFGARGVAEHPMISVPSVIGNALYDALGINFYELPLSPENVALTIVNNTQKY